MSDPSQDLLLSTKLYAPRVRRALVARPRLERMLDDGAERALTLVVGPPGSGKTTLVAEWRARSLAERPIGWLTLDEADNDPGRFWSYLVAALQEIDASLGGQTSAVLRERDPQARPGRELTVLLNELSARERPFSLVLEDYHVIDNASIHDGLGFVLTHMPSSAHLVLTSRVEPPLPLARLRVRDELVEIRAADLRFTEEEAASFLRDTMDLALDEETLHGLEARTEGWVAGLQLAALALRRRGADTAFAGDHPFVLDYLADEVLREQDEDMQGFLLRTCVLDRLSGPLCDALTGGADGAARLAALEADDLFVVALEAEGGWYRYHRLFRDFLRSRLEERSSPEEIRALHRRAADWFEAQGPLSRAVRHALAAGDPQRAASLVEHVAEATWRRGRHETLATWIERLPREILQQRPRLLLDLALARLLAGQSLEGVLPVVAEADAALAGRADEESRALRARRSVILALVAGLREQPDDAVRHGAQALRSLPAEDRGWRGIAQIDMGLAQAGRGDYAAAAEAFQQARRLAEQGDNPYAAWAATVNLARAEDLDGQLRAAEARYRDALARSEAFGFASMPLAGLVHAGLAGLLREWLQPEVADRHAAEGLRLATAGPRTHVRSAVIARLTRGQLRRDAGDFDAAASELDAAEALIRRHGRTEFAVYVQHQRALLALARGELLEAARLAAGLAEAERGASAPRVDQALLKARIWLDRGEAERAAAQLREHVAHVAERPSTARSTPGEPAEASAPAPTLRQAIVARALLALAREGLGRRDEALAALAEALLLAEPEGYARSLLELGAPLGRLLRALVEAPAAQDRAPATPLARSLLDAFDTPGPADAGGEPAPQGDAAAARGGLSPDLEADVEPLVEPLSERELEVLVLIAEGASNREIAERLVIALSTVKTHVNHIFGKLGVGSRTQAVARGRELAILD